MSNWAWELHRGCTSSWKGFGIVYLLKCGNPFFDIFEFGISRTLPTSQLEYTHIICSSTLRVRRVVGQHTCRRGEPRWRKYLPSGSWKTIYKSLGLCSSNRSHNFWCGCLSQWRRSFWRICRSRSAWRWTAHLWVCSRVWYLGGRCYFLPNNEAPPVFW